MTTEKFSAALDAIKAAFPKKKSHLHRFWAGTARDSEKSIEEFIFDLKDRIASTKKADKELRELLRGHFGKGNFRIRSNDTVDVYGKMPNSDVTGWWYYGDTEQALECLRMSR